MSDKIRTIVIGTSLSPAGDHVVRTGAAIARAAGASAWLAHAYAPATYTPEMAGPKWLELQTEAVRDGLMQQARRTGLTDLPGFKADQLCAMAGSPRREIEGLARRVKADLIVLGAEESGALHRAMLGSTADGVIRHAPCPVFAVRSASAFPPRHVEIPVDLSPISARAVGTGLGFLTQVGAPLGDTEVLFVLSPFEVAGSIHFTRNQIERFAREELLRFIAANGSGHPPHLARIRNGYPREEILAVLRERQVDLAVLGTHGRGGVERLAIGSVASEVMHQAACSLLIIPPETTAEREDVPREQPSRSADWTNVSDENAVRPAAGAAQT